jgi:hypothetical protein
MQRRFTPSTVAYFCGLVSLGLWTAVLFTDPALAHGASIGASGVFILFCILLAGVTVSVLICKEVWPHRNWGFGASALYFVSVIFLSLFVNDAITRTLDRTVQLGEGFAQSKITYFCVTKFSAPLCIDLVNSCPQCAKRLNPVARHYASDRVREFQNELYRRRIEHEESLMYRKPASR